jgi:hypothetical protein
MNNMSTDARTTAGRRAVTVYVGSVVRISDRFLKVEKPPGLKRSAYQSALSKSNFDNVHSLESSLKSASSRISAEKIHESQVKAVTNKLHFSESPTGETL